MKEYSITNYGGNRPESKVMVSEETFNKVESLDRMIQAMRKVSPEIAKSLEDNYRNGVTEYTIDDAIKFVELMDLGFICDMVSAIKKGRS